ncbi:mCG145837, partial [Mus musculus]
ISGLSVQSQGLPATSRAGPHWSHIIAGRSGTHRSSQNSGYLGLNSFLWTEMAATQLPVGKPVKASCSLPPICRNGTWSGLRLHCCCCCCWTQSLSCFGEGCSHYGTPRNSSSLAGSHC